MGAERLVIPLGWRVYALGVMALGMLCLAWGDFDSGQPVPEGFPARAALVYAAGSFLLLAGAAVQIRRSVMWGAGALSLYYGLIVTLLMNGRVILRHAGEYGAYSGAAEQLALAMGALLIVAQARENAVAQRAAVIVFGLCVVLFGGAHFVYLSLTAPLVPAWLPPSQVFWAYATGIAQIAAGLAFVSGVQLRLAALLLTALYASFALLVHAPLLLAHPGDHFVQTENALNLALMGAAWVVSSRRK